MDLSLYMTRAVARMFALGSQLVRSATYYRPASYATATGLASSAEVAVACSVFVASYRPGEIGSVVVHPGDEKVFVRAAELASIAAPAEGDYIVEASNSLRRDVMSLPKLDPAGVLWTFHCARSLNQDWGDLSAATDSEDRGTLADAASSEDFGSLL